MRLLQWLTYWYFKLKSKVTHISYIQGTRIPLDYPKYMFYDMSQGQTVELMTIEEQLQHLKSFYNEDKMKQLIPDGTKLMK